MHCGGLISVCGGTGLDGGIEKLAVQFRSRQALLRDELAERLLYFRVEVIGQLMGIVAPKRLLYENFHGGQQCAMAGKPDTFVRPESAIVEMSDFGQSIEAAAMRVAGEVIQLLQFTKDGETGTGAKHTFQFGQIGDFITAKILAQDRGLEGSWSHNVIVLTPDIR